MALCMLIPAVLGIVVPVSMMKRYPDLTDEYARTMTEITSAANEFVNCMPIIKMYGLTAEKFKKYSTAALAYTQCLTKMARCSCRPLAVTIVVLDSGILFTLPAGGILYLRGMLPLQTFLLFILLTLCFYNAFFSLLNIMMGHLELESGLKEFDTEALMDLTSFMFQDVFLAEDTLLENIRMGSSASDEQVRSAAKAAWIHDFILSLPKGCQTKIGDHGVKLSGGQQQQIAIARAILKDAPIIIFGEATSYSDIENEHKIQLALQNLLKDKTTIMIAHRLHTIRDADNIVVFEGGRAVEQGRHNDLIAAGEYYNRMWSAYLGRDTKKEAYHAAYH